MIDRQHHLGIVASANSTRSSIPVLALRGGLAAWILFFALFSAKLVFAQNGEETADRNEHEAVGSQYRSAPKSVDASIRTPQFRAASGSRDFPAHRIEFPVLEHRESVVMLAERLENLRSDSAREV